jgi:hypothetical protein
MNFGVREVCDLEFTKISGNGPKTFKITSAKMSTIESASTTVYAQGGRGNNRLRAWEGEKTVTFTVEDALITLESFYALTGASVATGSNSGVKFSIYPTSFAGSYKITANTLFRDDKGVDHYAEIYIPNAKLQTTLNLSMASTGDPSTFTFTFDAMPSHEADENKLLFHVDIHGNTADGADPMSIPSGGDKTYVTIAGETQSITGANPKLKISSAGFSLTADGATGEVKFGTISTWVANATATDGVSFFANYGTDETITLVQGTHTRVTILA